MPFTLSLQVDSIQENGQLLKINDVSVWVDATYTRADYGVFLSGKYRIDSEGSPVHITSYDPITASSWTSEAEVNGRYSYTGYAFLVKDTEVPNEGDVHVDTTDKKLYQWVSGAWVEISLENAILKAVYTSEVLEVPVLTHAYTHKNLLNLEYVKDVKSYVQRGAEQNELFYRRQELDYFRALIEGAEYNWALKAFSNYYETVTEINLIITNSNDV